MCDLPKKFVLNNSENNFKESKELFIGNNCCGGNYYKLKNIKYNNPFIWMVLPYDSMYNLMLNFDKINFNNIEMKKSTIRENTFIIVIDNQVEIHYVHHEFRPDTKELTVRIDGSGRHLGNNHIWEYIWNKYEERIKDMLSTNMQPKFIIHDQDWGNNKHNIKDLIKLKCSYKRCFITTENIDFDYNKNLIKIIHVNKRTEPEPMINTYFNEINDFFIS